MSKMSNFCVIYNKESDPLIKVTQKGITTLVDCSKKRNSPPLNRESLVSSLFDNKTVSQAFQSSPCLIRPPGWHFSSFQQRIFCFSSFLTEKQHQQGLRS